MIKSVCTYKGACEGNQEYEYFKRIQELINNDDVKSLVYK
jgi:hypothetical protein